jgi:beta-glucoside kinase
MEGIHMKRVLSIDVGGTFTKYGLIDQHSHISHYHTIATDSIKDDPIAFFHSIICQYETEITAVTFSLPGYIDNTTGIITNGATLKKLTGVHLESALDTNKKIFIENDANCAAFSELSLKSPDRPSSFLYITLGTGIGGAFIHNNKCYRGISNRSCEFGSMVLNFNQGTHLNWNRLGSVPLLKKEISLLINHDMKEEEFHQILQSYNALEFNEENESETLIHQFYRSHSIGVSNLLQIFNPPAIYFSGGITNLENFIPNLFVHLEKVYPDIHTVRLATAGYKDKAGLIGAALLFFKGPDSF